MLGAARDHDAGRLRPVRTTRLSMLAILPEPLCREFADALDSLKEERISAVLGQLAAIDDNLYRLLSHLVDNFDYPTILNALKNAKDGDVT